MKKRVLLVLAVVLAAVSVLVLSFLEGERTVFSENFQSGNFAGWSRTFSSTGSTQTVSNGVARFVVPTPTGGNVTCSYIVKDGFTSTVNSTIIASQDVLVSMVPYGCTQGMGAIFFLYVCDSRDLSGNFGNIGVGIDGCGLWSLWIGGNKVYNYVFQSAGAAPVSNTWYHITLSIDNSAAAATLTVDGVTVLSASQSEFTDANHAVSLMCGMGEDWWPQGPSQLELDVKNVKLDISDATIPPPTLNPTVSSSTNSLQAPSSAPSYNPAPSPTPAYTATPQPSITPLPAPSQTLQPTDSQATKQADFPLWIVLPVAVAVAVCMGVFLVLKKR